jgi:transposase
MTMTSTNDTCAKDKALRKHNSLNPHPENVTDELFGESDFFDPRDLAQVKYEMLRHVRKDGWSVAQAARAFGFSRNAFYRAQEAFKQNGIAGLMRERPGPRRAHKFTDEVMDFIEKALLKDGALTTVRLRRMIKKRFGISVHRRSIERSLTRRQKKGQKLLRLN